MITIGGQNATKEIKKMDIRCKDRYATSRGRNVVQPSIQPWGVEIWQYNPGMLSNLWYTFQDIKYGKYYIFREIEI